MLKFWHLERKCVCFPLTPRPWILPGYHFQDLFSGHIGNVWNRARTIIGEASSGESETSAGLGWRPRKSKAASTAYSSSSQDEENGPGKLMVFMPSLVQSCSAKMIFRERQHCQKHFPITAHIALDARLQRMMFLLLSLVKAGHPCQTSPLGPGWQG